jgi:hypothetical protein
VNDDSELKRGSLVQRVMASLPLPAGLRPDVRELAPLFRFGAVAMRPDGQPAVDHPRFVALVDSLAYFNACRREVDMRLAGNSKAFQRSAEDMESAVWTPVWQYFRAVSPMIAAPAYFAVLGEFIDEQESDLVLLRPIFLRIVLDTVRTIADKSPPPGLRFVHSGIRLATGPTVEATARAIGLLD